MRLEAELKKLGLGEKEARVYLAGLMLGSARVQDLARHAKIKRPTAYLAVESLIRMGLMSSVEEEGRRFFISEAPERLGALFASRAHEIQMQEETHRKLLPELLALASGGEEKPRVRYYEGLDGLEAMREIFLKTKDRHMISFFAKDDYQTAVPETLKDVHRERLAKLGIGGRVLYTSERRPIEFLAETVTLWQARRVPANAFPFSGELAVLGERVAVVSYGAHPLGIIIESLRVSKMIRAIFELAWNGARA